jgi:hypothetical protein
METEIEKIEAEIERIQNRIRNTEYDLLNSFKGNKLLETKLENSKKLLESKQGILEGLKQNPQTAQKLEQLEENISEKNTINISPEQEKQIESEIEKEFE